MRQAYSGTAVPVERSQGQIKAMLQKYGALGIQFMEDWAENKLFVRFKYPTAKGSAFVLLKAPIPKAGETGPKGRRRTEVATEKAQAQNERIAWRAVYYVLKSRMESVELGIETFEAAFLAHFELPDGQGNTIGDKLIPRLGQDGGLKLLEGAK